MPESANPESRPQPAGAALSEKMRLGKVPLYLWPNLLSLDAVVVAVVWLWCFSVDRGIPLVPVLRPWVVAGTLALAVWLIYTADRLIDASRMKDAELSTPRHRFARVAAFPLMLLWIVGFVVLIRLSLFELPRIFFQEGIRVGLLVFFYFVIRLPRMSEFTAAKLGLPDKAGKGVPIMEIIWFVLFVGGGWLLIGELPMWFFQSLGELGPVALLPRGRFIMLVFFFFLIRFMRTSELRALLPKEICCGLIFALGVTFPVFTVERHIIAGVITPEFLFFALLCVLNCIAISAWEWREDQANDSGGSIVTSFPSLRKYYAYIAFGIAVLAAWLGGLSTSPALLSVALSAALIGSIGLAEGALSKNLRRLLVDVALLSPLVIVPIFG